MDKLFEDIKKLPTPSYVVDEQLLTKNLSVMKEVRQKTGCKILLAQKAFSMYATYPLIGKYLDGTTASSLFEAKLGAEYMGGETHIFSPAYRAEEFSEILSVCGHIIFNSFFQWEKYRNEVLKTGHAISPGLRINPGYSEIETEIYNPCAPYSRLGIPALQLRGRDLSDIEGLHFHTMCEQNSDTLRRTITEVEKSCGEYLKQMKWLNFGGGHHITREDYDIELLIDSIDYIQNKYNVEVYLEPGEAVALNTGFLVSEVLDIVENDMKIAILDTSAACHMPDVLEMPYRPPVIGGGEPGEFPHTYRLGTPTCLAGDIIGDYSFQKPLSVGDKVIFGDMAIYSMVKNNTFNGINLPSIYLRKADGTVSLVKKFGYEDFKSRL